VTEDDRAHHLMKAARIGGPLASGGTILAAGKFRLPDDRVVPRRMTADELEAFWAYLTSFAR
jgi:hypothetical protein